MSRVVLVSGRPASGKTTLARRLATDLSWPLVAKDDLKETIAEVFGVADLAASRRAGLAATMLLYRLAGELARAGAPVVVESAFHRAYAGQLRPVVEAADVVLVHCDAGGLAAGRYVVDWAAYDVMDLGVPTLIVDTRDGYDPVYGEVLAFTRE